MEGAPIHVTSFYRFIPLDEARLAELESTIAGRMADLGMKGLVLLAPEGVNATVGGTQAAVEGFKFLVRAEFGQDTRFKDSVCGSIPFKRPSVQRRQEIVGMKRPDLVPEVEENRHLTPSEWHVMLASDDPKIVVDTRNRYETQLGMFKGAIDPDIGHFSDWGDYLERADLPKDVPVMIYCTGGIRCEKAILEMHARGYEKVVQLRDGILGYLAEYPDGLFEGECFVFDDRVAVDADLAPSERYAICPGCGMPTDAVGKCPACGGVSHVCEKCAPTWRTACRKHCLGVLRQRAERELRRR